MGRGLRRQSYDLNEEERLNPEYADVLGILFDFTAKPVVAAPAAPRETVWMHAVRPDHDALEIRFPWVEGYRLARRQVDQARADFAGTWSPAEAARFWLTISVQVALWGLAVVAVVALRGVRLNWFADLLERRVFLSVADSDMPASARLGAVPAQRDT